MVSFPGMDTLASNISLPRRALRQVGCLTAGILAAFVLIPSIACAEGAHGTIEVAGSEATFHVMVPPKEDWSSFSWFANAYTDTVSDHCAAPDSNDLVAVSGEETSTEASFSANLAQLRDHIGTWDICLYAHGFGPGEGLLAEAPYVYPSPTGTVTVLGRSTRAIMSPLELAGQMNAQARITEPYSGPPGWRWWWAVTALPAGTPCSATFAPHSYIGSSSVRESNAAITPEYTTLYFPEASGTFALCLYVDIEDALEEGVRLIGSGSYTFPAATPPPPAAPATPVKTATPIPKPLTRGQKLSKALKACRKERRKRKREACERKARKQYRPPRKKSSIRL